jgi:hypothetical protein
MQSRQKRQTQQIIQSRKQIKSCGHRNLAGPPHQGHPRFQSRSHYQVSLLFGDINRPHKYQLPPSLFGNLFVTGAVEAGSRTVGTEALNTLILVVSSIYHVLQSSDRVHNLLVRRPTEFILVTGAWGVTGSVFNWSTTEEFATQTFAKIRKKEEKNGPVSLCSQIWF